MRARGWHSYQYSNFGVRSGSLPMPYFLKGGGLMGGGGAMAWKALPPEMRLGASLAHICVYICGDF